MISDAHDVLSALGRKIYKFRSFDPERPDRLARIFTHHELYFPKPAELNDPFECRPIARPPRLNSWADRWRVERSARKLLVKYGTPKKLAKARAKSATDPEFMKLRAQEMTDQLPVDMQEYRICSFSATWEPILLWSHYADAHRGICIGFSVNNDDMGSAMQVSYSEELPSIEYFDRNEEETLKALILTKSSAWRYEEEFRMVSKEPPIHPQIQLVNQRYNFPANRLVEVILGCEATQNLEDRVRGWIANYGTPVRLFRTSRSKEKFSLDLTEI